MISPPQIVQTSAQAVAMIRITVPREQIGQVMGPNIRAIYAALAVQNIAATGPWLTHHLKRPDTGFDFEACVPVASAITPTAKVTNGTLRAARVARTVYQGGYEGLGTAWGELEAWIAAQGLRSAADLWEVYVLGPESGQDASHWRTELNRPLAD